MQTMIRPQECQAAKRHIITQFEQGDSAQKARVRSIVPMQLATVYCLLKRVQTDGEMAFVDGRHGHPVKLHREVLTFLIEHCQALIKKLLISV